MTDKTKWYECGFGRATGGLTRADNVFKYQRRNTQISVKHNRVWIPDGVNPLTRKDGWIVQYGQFNERIKKGFLREVFPCALDAMKAVEGQLELVRLMALDVVKVAPVTKEF